MYFHISRIDDDCQSGFSSKKSVRASNQLFCANAQPSCTKQQRPSKVYETKNEQGSRVQEKIRSRHHRSWWWCGRMHSYDPVVRGRAGSVLGLEAGANLTSDPEIGAIGLPAFLLPGTAAFKYFWSGWQQTMPGLNGRASDWTTGFIY